MSESFTYEPPDADLYFQTLVKYLKFKKESQLVDLLTGGKCVISSSGAFSRKRWNAYYTTVDFYIPIERFVLVNDEVKRKLIDACACIMPPEVGFDVMDVRFSPLIEEASFEKALGRDFDQIAFTLSQEEVIKVLPDDIREKGREMATAYLHLYCVENCIRLFIQEVAKRSWEIITLKA